AWDEDHTYYMVAYMEERFDSNVNSYETHSYTTGVFQDWENGIYDGDGVLDYYYSMGLEIVYGQSLATCGAEVVYSNAVYDSEPVLTFNDAFNEMKVNGTEVYQWQVLEGNEWVDHGNYQYSPELAIQGLLKHRGLTGKQVRLKITPEYGDKRPIYSNVCTVQKDQNTRWPDLGNFTWEADPDHSGKYILNTNTFNDWLELLIYPYDSDRDLSTLDWSKAISPSEAGPVVFDDLEVGVYTVYARFKETSDYEAGTEIGYSKVVVGPYAEPKGTNILYDNKPVNEIFVKKGECFTLTVGPVPTNATLNSTNVTTWMPDTEKSNIIQYYTGSNGLYAPFNKSFSGRTIELMADNLGYVTISAVTTLPNGTSAVEPITVRVVPDNYVPYTVSVVNRGEEVLEGGSFTPQLTLKGRVEMLTKRRATKFEVEDLLDSEIKTQLQSDTIKQQLRDRLTWALVNPIPQPGMPPYTESTAKASINTKTGEITLKDAAVAGNVINFVGILNDPYLGQIIIPGYITVAAAPEPEPHTCDYEGYAVIEGNLSTHYRVCECGKKKTEPHSFTEFSSESAGKMVSKYVCPCGISYSKTVDVPVNIHSHTLEYMYDGHDHWQICTDEECPDSFEGTHEVHSFKQIATADSGKPVYACSVCSMIMDPTDPGGCLKDNSCPMAMFKDLDMNGWYHDGVHYCIDNGLMNGTSADRFSPEASASRAMIVTVLYRLEGSPEVTTSSPFTDLKADWYKNAVIWAHENGIVNGTGGTTFDPDGTLTREQITTILYRYAEFKGFDVSTKSSLDAFSDSANVGSWAVEAMSWAYGTGLITGAVKGGETILDPQGIASRAQVATILYRFTRLSA
ncbi:MAG: S-layer homology domain-containing protein, partial [Clostridia bacterium]|nr:S-layer homology domain-containing protein [Clostridia bacterium]